MREAGVPRAEVVSRPSLFDCYRFFTSGRVPPGHTEWARRQFLHERWNAVSIVSDIVLWAVISMSTRAEVGEWSRPVVIVCLLSGVLIFTPRRGVWRRKRILAQLAPPTEAVLEEIGESVPQGTGLRLPPLH